MRGIGGIFFNGQIVKVIECVCESSVFLVLNPALAGPVFLEITGEG